MFWPPYKQCGRLVCLFCIFKSVEHFWMYFLQLLRRTTAAVNVSNEGIMMSIFPKFYTTKTCCYEKNT